MKNYLTTLFVILFSFNCYTQNTLSEGFYEVNVDNLRLIIVVTKSQTLVCHKNFIPYSIGVDFQYKMQIDTLGDYKKGQFGDKKMNYKIEGNKFVLLKNIIAPKTYFIKPIQNINTANRNLNSLYFSLNYYNNYKTLCLYFSQYKDSEQSINEVWVDSKNQEMNYIAYKTFADNYFKLLTDSILAFKAKYSKVTHYIIANLSTLSYPNLKDSIKELLNEPIDYCRYKTKLITAISIEKPEIIFNLAEDFPQQKALIFNSAYITKKIGKKLKKEPGFEALKLEYFKDRKLKRND